MSQGKRQRQAKRLAKSLQANRLVVGNFPVADLCVDPARFQYKRSPDSSGSVGSLDGVRSWSIPAEGILDVWLDPVDGRTYIVNGHNRLALAKRLGVAYLPVKYLQAKTAIEARQYGAIANIAAGHGTALDAARFFRAGNWDRDRCHRHGIKLSGSIARDGLAIARLCPELFDRALSGTLPESRAAVIGSSNLSESQQLALVTAIEDRESSGKDCDDRTLRELVGLVRVAATETVEQSTLFGFEAFSRSLIFETAEIQAAIISQLKTDRRVFRTVVRSADTLESTAIATVNRATGQQLASTANELLERFRVLKAQEPIAGWIGDAARAIADGSSKAAAIESIYELVVSHCQSTV